MQRRRERERQTERERVPGTVMRLKPSSDESGLSKEST
jgi:hypothetical protein